MRWQLDRIAEIWNSEVSVCSRQLLFAKEITSLCRLSHGTWISKGNATQIIKAIYEIKIKPFTIFFLRPSYSANTQTDYVNILILMFATPKSLTHILIFNASVKHNRF